MYGIAKCMSTIAQKGQNGEWKCTAGTSFLCDLLQWISLGSTQLSYSGNSVSQNSSPYIVPSQCGTQKTFCATSGRWNKAIALAFLPPPPLEMLVQELQAQFTHSIT